MRYIKLYSLLAIYLFSCISLVIDFHYCGGELESVALYHADEDGCCGEDEGTKHNCCKDEFLLIDTDDSEKSNNCILAQIDVVKNITSNHPVIISTINNDWVIEKMVIPINHAPPNNIETHLFIKNCILLI